MASKTGLIGVATAVLGANAKSARACHEDPPVIGYGGSTSIGVFLGLAFGSRTRFIYGADLRVSDGNHAGIIRIEGRNSDSVRFTLAGHGIRNDELSGELGVAWHSARKGTGIESAIGLHAAFGVYDDGGGLHAVGMLPFYGDLRNWDVGATAAIVFGEVKGPCSGGRRLRVGEGSVLPAAAVYTNDEIASAYIEDARTEYASIWAFERMAAELAAAGAPADLVRAAREAARDEARHTQLCAELAASPFSLLPLTDDYLLPRWSRPASAATTTLAREAWLDGCLGEGISARHALHAAIGARGRAADVQRAIAADERRHADLAWAVLEWAWRQRDAMVRDWIVDAAGTEPELSDGVSLDADPDRAATKGRLKPESAQCAAQSEADEAHDRLRRMIS